MVNNIYKKIKNTDKEIDFYSRRCTNCIQLSEDNYCFRYNMEITHDDFGCIMGWEKKKTISLVEH